MNLMTPLNAEKAPAALRTDLYSIYPLAINIKDGNKCTLCRHVSVREFADWHPVCCWGQLWLNLTFQRTAPDQWWLVTCLLQTRLETDHMNQNYQNVLIWTNLYSGSNYWNMLYNHSDLFACPLCPVWVCAHTLVSLNELCFSLTYFATDSNHRSDSLHQFTVKHGKYRKYWDSKRTQHNHQHVTRRLESKARRIPKTNPDTLKNHMWVTENIAHLSYVTSQFAVKLLFMLSGADRSSGRIARGSILHLAFLTYLCDRIVL